MSMDRLNEGVWEIEDSAKHTVMIPYVAMNFTSTIKNHVSTVGMLLVIVLLCFSSVDFFSFVNCFG